MRSEIRQVIENSHLFAGLGNDLIEEIAASVTRRRLAAGEILFQQGDPANAIWGVLSGRVAIGVRASDGKEMVLDDFREGEVFGEVGVLDFGPRRVEARAAQASELFRLDRTQFLRHLQASPELCFRTFSLLCAHLRDTTETLEDTALYKLPSRLAKRLVLMADELSAKQAVTLQIGQAELAGMLGVNREAVNRNLRQFEEKGFIALGRQRIDILDRNGLAGLAAPMTSNGNGAWGTASLEFLTSDAFAAQAGSAGDSGGETVRTVGLLAVDAGDYSRALMSDAAGTLENIRTGLMAIDRAIRQCEGRAAWHSGDRVLAEFPDAGRAMQAALLIQEKIGPGRSAGKVSRESLFRIGVHHGEVAANDGYFLGEAVNAAIGLTRLSGSGGIAVSGPVLAALEGGEQLDLKYLGEHELTNVPGTVPVYTARSFGILRMLALRAESWVPRRFRPAALASAVLLLMAGVWLAGDRAGPGDTGYSVSPLSIAVLPFTQAGDSEFDYLSAGLPEEIRSLLSSVPGVRVIGRESSDYIAGRSAAILDVGASLNVAWLLTGDLQGNGDEIVLTTELLSAADDRVVWDERFQGPANEMTGVGPAIVRHIAASMGVADGDRDLLPLLGPLTRHPEAHSLYLRALAHQSLGRQHNAIHAVPLLEEAVALDPSFAEAHARLSRLYGMSALDRQEPFTPELRGQLARNALQRAVSLKPESPLVLAEAARARFWDGDLDGALVLAEKALRTDPGNVDALGILYMIQWELRDWNATILTAERLIRSDPLSVGVINRRWNQLDLHERHQEALEVAERALALYAEKEIPQAHAWRAISLLKLGDRLGAIEAARKSSQYGYPLDLWTGLDYDWTYSDELFPAKSASALVYVEEYERVRELLIEHAGIIDPDGAATSESPDFLINLGELEAIAGNHEKSVEYFERAGELLGGGMRELIRYVLSFNVLDLSRQSHFSLALLNAYRNTGQTETADRLAEEFEIMLAEHIALYATVSESAEFRYLYKEAQFHAIEGRPSVALEKLRTWFDRGTFVFSYVAWDPFLDGLRGTPDFEALVAEVEAWLAQVRMEFHARQASVAKT